MVRIGRVTESEQGRDEEDDAEGGPIRQRCDPAVEPEHDPGSPGPCDRFDYTTPGIALAVMRIPTARIRPALTAGSVRTTRPSSEKRPNVRRATTATSP